MSEERKRKSINSSNRKCVSKNTSPTSLRVRGKKGIERAGNAVTKTFGSCTAR